MGGTLYWIQHLLFPNHLVNEHPLETSQNRQFPPMSDELRKSLDTLPPHLFDLFNCLSSDPPNASSDPDGAFALHSLLKILDPSIAARWHWKDTRKVHRSLNILKETGRPASELISDQSNDLDVKPRYASTGLYMNMLGLIPRQVPNSVFLAICQSACPARKTGCAR